MPQKSSIKKNGAGKRDAAITDERFQNFASDPRYRLPSRKDKKVKIDSRFSRMLEDEDFAAKASVDRYGRKLPKGAEVEKLRRRFVPEDDEEIDADDDVEAELARVSGKFDPARQGGFDESSSEEESSSDGESSSGESEDETSYREIEEAEAGIQGGEEGGDAEMPLEEASARLAAVNLDWDNIRAVDLMAVARSFCPPEGRIKSVQVLPSEFGKEKLEREEMEGPPKELFTSSKKNERTSGITNKDGSSSEAADDEDGESEEDDEEIKAKLLAQSTSEEANTEVNSSALRKYQLTRLRYYYAVLSCDSPSTALALYRNMDGREYLSSANFFDLRFIPDEVDFEDDIPRDECNDVPTGYRPNEFVTEALTHSKVKLTWDAEEDKSRKEVQKRAFKAGDAEEADVAAYLASDTSDEEDSDGGAGQVGKQSKAEAARSTLRAALGLASSKASEDSKKSRKKKNDGDDTLSKKERRPVGDMQITFTAGLSNAAEASEDGEDDKQNSKEQRLSRQKNSVFVNTPDDVREEDSRQAYIRKERERKQRRKDLARARRAGEEADTNTAAEPKSADKDGNQDEGDEDDPFADPFFEDPVVENEKRKTKAKQDKRKAKAAQEAESAAAKSKERAALELLLADEDGDNDGTSGRHFDMASVKKAEQPKHKKKSKRQKVKDGVNGEAAAENGDDFAVDVKDPRFAMLYDDHEYAINPHDKSLYSGTKAMENVLEEGRKRRREQRGSDEDLVERNPSKKGNKPKTDNIDDLVSNIKKRKKVMR